MKQPRIPYRWQDRVLALEHTAVDLMVTTLAVLVIGSAAFAATAGATGPPHPPVKHVASGRTPSLAELAKRPVMLRQAQDCL